MLVLRLDSSAIEKILGENEEAKIEVKNYIIQQFTNKYLKGIVSEEPIRKAVSEITDFMNRKISEIIEKDVGKITIGKGFEFSEPLKLKIENEIQKEVDCKINNIYENIKVKIDDHVNHIYKNIEDNINYINKNIDSYLDNKLNIEFEKRVQEEINKRIIALINSERETQRDKPEGSKIKKMVF